MIFIEIRDKYGIAQTLFLSSNKKYFSIAKKIKNEFCIKIIGIIKKRPNNQINKNINTGKIEILGKKIKIINKSKILPIDIKKKNSENKRLKYRYLDLRSSYMINKLQTRSRIINISTNILNKKKFTNIETPILYKNTSEGARSYLVPSRIHKKKFYALAQSPQIFKQLLMIGGLDRYYQITKCFRDEDLRSNRQPEFTQIDIEISFEKFKKIKKITEKIIKNLWYKIKKINLKKFQKITYKESINKFGSDTPDLRFSIKIQNISHLFNPIEKSIFFKKKKTNYKIAILHIKKNKKKIKNEHISSYIKITKTNKIKNFFWIINNTLYNTQNIQKNSKQNKKIIKKIFIYTKAKINDIIFIISGKISKVNYTFGILRTKIANDLSLIKKNIYKPIWIVDFPLFKKNIKNKIISMHHPFTLPKKKNIKYLLNNPLKILAKSYDIIINGLEIGSGSERIHHIKLQKKIFNILKINKIQQKKEFGSLLNALKYGAPPHCGIALGLDRLTMLLTNTKNIKNVIAFPKNTECFDVMNKSPNKINKKILNKIL